MRAIARGFESRPLRQSGFVRHQAARKSLRLLTLGGRMSFMDSYKRLDNLCKTFPDYPKGISSYIEVMERSNQIRHRCIGWSSDYDRLKKYRYIRNQIAHDNGIYEDEVCDWDDIDWLENFHSRMLNQTDPLGQYFKSQRASIQRPTTNPVQSPKPSQHNTTPPKPSRQPIGCGACITLFCTIALAIAWVLFNI